MWYLWLDRVDIVNNVVTSKIGFIVCNFKVTEKQLGLYLLLNDDRSSAKMQSSRVQWKEDFPQRIDSTEEKTIYLTKVTKKESLFNQWY